MTEVFIPSTVKPPGRTAWIAAGHDTSQAGLIVFLDGELYLNRVGASDVLTTLAASRRIPPVVAVFVSNNSAAARHADYVCDAEYTRFLERELVPTILQHGELSDLERVVLVGLSLSGLAVAHAALTSTRFPVAVCQSPSFWWKREQLAASLQPAAGEARKLWVSVGDGETTHGVAHPPTGLYQGASQLDSCRRGAEALKNVGHVVAYREFHGGHDPLCWREDLELALPWAMSV